MCTYSYISSSLERTSSGEDKFSRDLIEIPLYPGRNLCHQSKSFLTSLGILLNMFYFMFCIYFECVPIPTSVQILTLYAQFLSRSFKSVDSIRNYNSAIKLYPQFESFHFKFRTCNCININYQLFKK
jgi:hypothetical protein